VGGEKRQEGLTEEAACIRRTARRNDWRTRQSRVAGCRGGP